MGLYLYILINILIILIVLPFVIPYSIKVYIQESKEVNKLRELINYRYNTTKDNRMFFKSKDMKETIYYHEKEWYLSTDEYDQDRKIEVIQNSKFYNGMLKLFDEKGDE